MVVAVDSIITTDAQSNAATTINLTTMTVGAGANRALIAVLTLQAAATLPSVKWDTIGANQTATLITSVSDTGAIATTYLYGLIAPVSGNKILTASWTGTSQVNLAGGCFTGVNQSGGVSSFTGFTSTGPTSTANTVNITSAVGNYCVGAWEGFVNFSSVSATQWYIDISSTTISSCASHATGGALVAFSETTTGTARAWGFAGADIIAAGAATAQVAYQPVYQSGPVQAQ